MACIFKHLNKLNLSLQVKKIDIFVNMSKVNAVKKGTTNVAEQSCIK